jgi:DNA-binding transcriptional ArsR family regulator
MSSHTYGHNMPTFLDQPSTEELNLTDIFTALAEPLRREAVVKMALLEEGTERSCASFGFPVAKSSLTHHFRVLREAGLITQLDYGNRRASILRVQDLNLRFPHLLPLLISSAEK